MVLASVWVYSQQFTGEINPSHDLVTLCCIHQERASICWLTFRVVWNDRPAQRVVVVADGIHAKANHVYRHTHQL